MSNTQENTPTMDAHRFERTVDKMYALQEMIPSVVGEEYMNEHQQRLRSGVGSLLDDVMCDLHAVLDALYKKEFATHDLKKTPSAGK